MIAAQVADVNVTQLLIEYNPKKNLKNVNLYLFIKIEKRTDSILNSYRASKLFNC
jgi:hypothetical protein